MTVWEWLAYGWPIAILAAGHLHHRHTRHQPPDN